MGMYGSVMAISEATIRRIHADPPLGIRLIFGEEEEAIARKPAGPGLIGRLLGRKPPAPPPVEPLELAPGEGRGVSLDKAWHAAHWLLTGSVWEGDPPLNFILGGGTDIDFDGPWNSPPHTFTPAETRAIAEALAQVSDEELGRRYDPAEMTRLEIYPEIWDRVPDGNENPQGYVMSAIAEVRTEVTRAVERGWGLLVVVD